jgi:ribosome-binding factor A
MSSRRTQKAAEAIREVVSMAILTELKDPRVRDVTVTHVEVTPDMRQAKVHVSIMGDEKKQKLTLHGLENSAGFLQSKVAKRIDTRYTPRLAFVLDLGVKRSIEIAQILQQVLPKQSTPADLDEADTGEPDTGESGSDDGDPSGISPDSPPSATDHG